MITADRRGWTSSLALALAEAGATVAVAGTPDSDATAAVDAVKGQGSEALAITADLTVSEDVESMISKVVAELGRVDMVRAVRQEERKRSETLDDGVARLWAAEAL